jgi:hypothetical protein
MKQMKNKTKKNLRNRRRQRGGKLGMDEMDVIAMHKYDHFVKYIEDEVKVFKDNVNKDKYENIFTNIKKDINKHSKIISDKIIGFPIYNKIQYGNLKTNLESIKKSFRSLISLIDSSLYNKAVLENDNLNENIDFSKINECLDKYETAECTILMDDKYKDNFSKIIYFNAKSLFIELDKEISEFKEENKIVDDKEEENKTVDDDKKGGKKRTKRTRGKKIKKGGKKAKRTAKKMRS